MFVSGIANYVQQYNPLQVQQPMNNPLQQLSQNLIAAQKQEARFDTVTISAAAEQTEHSPLEDVPDGVLEVYLHMSKMAAYFSQSNEANLIEYRNQLSAFDQTIQSYQDILDGNSALPEQMTIDDVSQLLESTKAAREQFLREGAQKLNQYTSQDLTADGNLFGKAYSMAGGSSRGNSNQWTIDPDAEDIYAEIDRVLAATHSVTQTFQQGVSAILSEMKQRGLIKEDQSLSVSPDQNTQHFQNRAQQFFQDINEELWTTYRQSMRSVKETCSSET